MLTNVSGHIPDGTIWDPAGSPYVLVGDAWNNAGETLTILPTVEVYTPGRSGTSDEYDLEFGGKCDADGVTFTGCTEIYVRPTGQLNLKGGCTTDSTDDQDFIHYQNGSSGTVSNSEFNLVDFKLYSDTVSVNNNTFTGSHPVYTMPTLVPELNDNTFNYAGTATIHVSGDVGSDTDWQVIGNASRYSLDSDVTVSSGVTLTVHPGVEVYTPHISGTADENDLVVDGTVDATDVAFAACTEIYVHGGGELNLNGCSTDTGGHSDFVYFYGGSTGTVSDSQFSVIYFYLYSDAVSVVNNTFSDANPVYTSPTLVPEFYDNTFNYAGTATIHVSGDVGSDTDWQVIGNASRYSLDSDVTVSSGVTLTIHPGVEVYTPHKSGTADENDLLVDGTINANGVDLTACTEIYVHGGGELNLSGCSTDTDGHSDFVSFSAGSTGTISDSQFNLIKLWLYSDGVSIDNNTFSDANPVYTTASLVPELFDNTFNYAGTATIHVSGDVGSDTDWQVIGSASRYQLDSDLAISPGVALTIRPGVEVYTPNLSGTANEYDFRVDGTVNAYGASFTGYSEIPVQPGGKLNLFGATVDGDWLHYYAGSAGQIEYTEIMLPLTIHSDATLEAENNDFSAGTVTAQGNSADTIDLRWNWWGSTDPAVIEGKITHRIDNASLPLVLFDPWLPVPPFWVPTIADIADVTPDPHAVPVDEIAIIFSRPVSGFDLGDLTLTRDGGGNLLTGSQTLTTSNDMLWTLGNLAGVTTDLGLYTLELTVDGSGIYDPMGQPILSDADETWLLHGVVLYGTSGDDEFEFQTDGVTHEAKVNGTPYSYDASVVKAVTFRGLEGDDSLRVTGTSGDETATFAPGGVGVVGDFSPPEPPYDYEVYGEDIEQIRVYGEGGTDTAHLTGSDDNDNFYSYEASSYMKDAAGSAFFNYVRDFESVEADVSGGGGLGTDRAYLYDSAAGDTFSADPDAADMDRASDGFVEARAIGFDVVRSDATGGGLADQAYLTGSDGDDRFYSYETYSSLAGPGYYLYAGQYGYVEADVTAGSATSRDRAWLFDTAGDDTFRADPTTATLDRGTTGTDDAKAIRFDVVRGYATAGGTNDRAYLTGSAGDDDFYSYQTYSYVKDSAGTAFYSFVRQFDYVEVDALAETTSDRAYINDTSGSDTFRADPTTATMDYGTTGTDNVKATDFEVVKAYARNGGHDEAHLTGSPGDDRLYGHQETAWLTGTGFYSFVELFDYVEADGAGQATNDRADLYDSKLSGNDTFTGYATAGALGRMEYAGGNCTDALNFEYGYARAPIDYPDADTAILFSGTPWQPVGDWENVIGPLGASDGGLFDWELQFAAWLAVLHDAEASCGTDGDGPEVDLASLDYVFGQLGGG